MLSNIFNSRSIGLLVVQLSLFLMLTHCTFYDLSRPIVQQGNLLPQSKIGRLKLGMQKEDVAILMGNSLISPLFNNDRWDYAYTLRNKNKPMQIKRLSLYFTKNVLSNIESS